MQIHTYYSISSNNGQSNRTRFNFNSISGKYGRCSREVAYRDIRLLLFSRKMTNSPSDDDLSSRFWWEVWNKGQSITSLPASAACTWTSKCWPLIGQQAGCLLWRCLLLLLYSRSGVHMNRNTQCKHKLFKVLHYTALILLVHIMMHIISVFFHLLVL